MGAPTVALMQTLPARPCYTIRAPPVIVPLLLVASSVVACVPDRPVHDPVDALIEGGPCPAGVRSLVDAWGGGSRYLAGPSSRGGTAAYRVPAGTIGHWVVIDAGGDGSLMVSRWADGLADLWLFDGQDCRAPDPRPGGDETPRAYGPESATRTADGPAFTDADLRDELRTIGAIGGAAVEASAAGGEHHPVRAVVVYAWSPHMPLSVDGYAEIVRAAESLGLRVVPVLIAGGNRDFARREASRVGIPDTGLREVASVELRMRDAQVHAPAVLVFARNRVSPVLPGYRDASAYRGYLEGFLDGR